MTMQGLSMASIKKNPAVSKIEQEENILIPIVFHHYVIFKKTMSSMSKIEAILAFFFTSILSFF